MYFTLFGRLTPTNPVSSGEKKKIKCFRIKPFLKCPVLTELTLNLCMCPRAAPFPLGHLGKVGERIWKLMCGSFSCHCHSITHMYRWEG